MQIREDDLKGSQIQALLRDHLADAHANSPPGSVYALDLTALQNPDITFWTVWDDDVLLGCGALKELDKTHGEIKSMRTAPHALKRGVGNKMLTHIITQANGRGYKRLSLETGNNAAYKPARALYGKFGFETCGPFSDYKDGTFSVFMTLIL